MPEVTLKVGDIFSERSLAKRGKTRSVTNKGQVSSI